MIITIPFKTPTINHLYYHRGNIKILKKEARELRKEIKEIATHTISEFADCAHLIKEFAVTIEIYEDWYCIDNSVKKKDIMNREKFLIDSVFKALGIDDKFIFYHSMRKVQSLTQEKAVITIEVL